MSAQLMELVRELKALNARKKAGEALSSTEEARRQELKLFLKSQLEASEPDAVTVTPGPDASRPAPRPGAAVLVQADIEGSSAMRDASVQRKAHAQQSDIDEAEAKALAAIRATKKRERANTPEEVMAQIKDTRGGYTPPADDFCQEQYYSAYLGEGFSVVSAKEAANLRPIDPRAVEAQRAIDVASAPSPGGMSVTVPPGLAFLDDFIALYARRVLPWPGAEVAVETDDPAVLIGGRKVTVHLLNGEKKQGTIKALRRGELGFKLEGPTVVEEIALSQVKAVFVHMQSNAQSKPSTGRNLTVMFRDQRSVQGGSDDYAPNAAVFTLTLPPGRGQFEKIIISASAVQSVT